MKRIALAVLLALSSRSFAYEVKTRVDDFTGAMSHVMMGNRLGCAELEDATLDLNIAQYIDKDQEASYELIAMFRGETWMFIEKGPSLQFIVDGARIDLRGDGSADRRMVTPEAHVMELASYGISLQALYSLAEAKTIKVRLVGAKSDIDGCFTLEDFQHFKDFLSQYAPRQKPQ